MADVIYGYDPEVIEAARETAQPAVRRLLDSGLVLAQSAGPERTFEAWVIEKWLAELMSEDFRKTAEYEYLRAQWEREG